MNGAGTWRWGAHVTGSVSPICAFVVHVLGCRICMCLIGIYTLCDSQYKSFYEHLYHSDGSLGTLDPAWVRLLHQCDSSASLWLRPTKIQIDVITADCLQSHIAFWHRDKYSWDYDKSTSFISLKPWNNVVARLQVLVLETFMTFFFVTLLLHAVIVDK